MRRWHQEVPLMISRWREKQRRRHPVPDTIEDSSQSPKRPGTFRKRRPFDCGRPRCGLCHWNKIVGYRPVRESTRRGRLNAHLEAIRWEIVASAWPD